MPRVLIVGGGLTGCTVAHTLARAGVASTILERAPVPGGLIRSEHLGGVLYEPHGSHIFHTEDTEVWELANRMTPFREYRHRVGIVVEGKLHNWPILLRDIQEQSRSREILAELEARRGLDAEARAGAANFEEWCLELMGPILYVATSAPTPRSSGGARRGSSQPSGRRGASRCAGTTIPTSSPIPIRAGPRDPTATRT